MITLLVTGGVVGYGTKLYRRGNQIELDETKLTMGLKAGIRCGQLKLINGELPDDVQVPTVEPDAVQPPIETAPETEVLDEDFAEKTAPEEPESLSMPANAESDEPGMNELPETPIIKPAKKIPAKANKSPKK